MKINSNFDGGNIEVISIETASDIKLKLRKDIHADFSQWFYFHLMGVKNQPCTLHILNVNDSTFPTAWTGYQALASYDRKAWFRVPTNYDGEKLTITHTPQYDQIYYAYFVPYSYERYQDLISAAQMSPICQVQTLCLTTDDHELHLLTIGQPSPNKRSCWIIARQHPGETMAGWFGEGLIERLLDPKDELAKQLLEKAVFYILPNMNPDGSIRGNIRANGAGIDLNRQWPAPDPNTSPEVYCVKQKMEQTGVDFFLDVHGDEAVPYVYSLGRNLSPNYSKRIERLENFFKESYQAADPNFQYQECPQEELPSIEQLRILASAVVGEMYDCLSFTIEMPFQDNKYRPDTKSGWSDERSKQLGRALLQPLTQVIDQLR